jgi:signal transduction histidine kinase
MKRLGVYLALVLPALSLGLWSVFPEADITLAAPLFHFYIVTFTTFAATVVSLFVFISVGETALPRHLLLAAAFAWMGAVFLIHGATTPNAIITRFHPAITVSSWLTLFGGGVIFLIGGFAPNHPTPRFLRLAAIGIAILYAGYVVLVITSPELMGQLLAVNLTPQLEDLVFLVTLGIWLAASVKHYFNYRQGHSFLDGLMAFEAGWFATATVSMFRFELWHAAWWIYHVLLLAGFLVAIVALWRSYEQIRAFRLTRYYGATSLVVTAALALIAAHLYSNLVFQSLAQQLEDDTAGLTQHMGAIISDNLPEVRTAEDLHEVDPEAGLREAVAWALESMEGLDAISLYDASGMNVYTTIVAEGRGVLPPSPEGFRASLAGAIDTELINPGDNTGEYVPSDDVHILEVYAPFRAAGAADTEAPIGVLVTLREAPQLTRELTLSRASGLVLAALSLGGLFTALLFIVYRADQLIRNRTRELEGAYADLRQAEGLRDDLTRMIVHDLRNPLTALTANLDLIGKTLNNPAYPDAPPRFLSGARAAGQRMTGMIDDLLNVGKFEAGELRPVLAPIYLPTLLTDKVESYRSQAEKEQKSLGLRAPAELPTVTADLALVGRVIDNLLSNAFKYTDAGGSIAVEAERKGHDVWVRIRDDGQGIPPEFHQRIFEKFVQVTESNGAPLRKGTGLGLAFCRLAVEAHGGHIRVESVPGQGSVFVFNLPLNHH